MYTFIFVDCDADLISSLSDPVHPDQVNLKRTDLTSSLSDLVPPLFSSFGTLKMINDQIVIPSCKSVFGILDLLSVLFSSKNMWTHISSR